MSLQIFHIKPYEVERKPYDHANDIMRILFDIEGDNSKSLNMLFLIIRYEEFPRWVKKLNNGITLELRLTELLVDLEPFENGLYSLMTGCDESMRDGDISKDNDLYAQTLLAECSK